MNTMLKGIVMAGGALLVSIAPFGSLAAQQVKPKPTTITVENTRDVPATVYLERGEFDLRMGTVAPHQREAFQLPKTMENGEEVQVFVHPEGGMDLSTPEFRVRVGENSEIFVPTNDVGYIPPPASPTIPDPGPGTTTVTVRNERAVPVTMFIDSGDFDTRIGTVPANGELTLPIPEWFVTRETVAEIIAHPEGEGDLASWDLDLVRGAHLFVKVPKYGT